MSAAYTDQGNVHSHVNDVDRTYPKSCHSHFCHLQHKWEKYQKLSLQHLEDLIVFRIATDAVAKINSQNSKLVKCRMPLRLSLAKTY